MKSPTICDGKTLSRRIGHHAPLPIYRNCNNLERETVKRRLGLRGWLLQLVFNPPTWNLLWFCPFSLDLPAGHFLLLTPQGVIIPCLITSTSLFSPPSLAFQFGSLFSFAFVSESRSKDCFHSCLLRDDQLISRFLQLVALYLLILKV